MACFILLLGFSWLHAEPKLGYAFSGGGARAYAHVGILKVLEANGIRPDYITGTSMGAVVGGLYAMGYDAAKIEEILLSTRWEDLLDDGYKRKDIYIGQKRWAPYGAVNLEMSDTWQPKLPSGVWVGNQLNLELARLFAPAGANTDFDRLPIPFGCIATDLVSGELVFFREGNLMQAVRASLSIPSIIEPFELAGRLYIDGGVSQNLPVNEVRMLGADCVIGVKTNSTLRERPELGNLLQVLDQTINIGMTANLNTSLDECDLILEPDLEGFRASDYRKAAQIIAAGEQYANANLDMILAFKTRFCGQAEKVSSETLPDPGRRKLRGLSVIGSEHLSSVKVREFLGLKLGESYSVNQIISACQDAWNSQLFHTVYPVIDIKPDGYLVKIHVKERTRRQLGVLLNYTSEEGLQAGAVLKMQNILLKNSIFHGALSLGGRTEYNLDYVKNFGELWGAYFRLFQYFTEKKRYYYDDDFNKVASVKAAELGLTGGVGVFANKLLAAEAFIYGFRTKLYRDISTVAGIDSLYLVSGAGIKLYHESLDDYYFPMTGFRSVLKFNFARSSQLSDYIYSKVYSSSDLYTPFHDRFSLKLGLELGSWFGEEQINVDPFYLGGSHGYMGYQRYEVSAPVYKIFELGLVANPTRNLYADLGVQGLNAARVDDWSADQEVTWSVYGSLGFRSALGPLRFAVAVREDSHPNYYLNLGYDLDIFHFSRR